MRDTEKIVRIEPYCEGFARVVLDYGMYAFVDEKGKLQKGRYKWVGSYHEGFAVVMLGVGKFAFIDKNGELQEGRYKDLEQYNEGFAAVQLEDSKWAFIDRNGKLQEGRYEHAWSYHEGFADVTVAFKDNSVAVTKIDKYGNIYLSKREWLDYIKNAPLSYKFIPPHYFINEKFVEQVDEIVKEVYVKKTRSVGSALNNAEEKFAEIRDDFENFCKMRVEKMKIVKEIMQKEEQERLERERVERERLEKKRLKQVKIEQAKEDLIQQINNLDIGKDRG